MLRQSAFVGNKKLLKAALHVHTTRSGDCDVTPEEMLRVYAEHGFEVVAITDHDTYNFKNFAPETGILVLPGVERAGEINDYDGLHEYHAVILGHEKPNNPYEQDQPFEAFHGYSQDRFQQLLDEHHAANQLTIYCHPEWSNTQLKEFERLKGNFAMEIWNTGSVLNNGLDTNAAYWDDLLAQGKRIFGCAVDDMHNAQQQAGGWVCINANKDVECVLTALENGDFYSSCGPEIKDFYIEEGVAVVECTPCKEIIFRTGRWPGRRIVSDDASLVRFEMPVRGCVTYVRATVMDEQGRRAWTNPIFTK